MRHELIAASAGSGKTYQLVRRYLHLLALGVEPESIVAMTFTRKAAGEFFGRILTRLAKLASGEEAAAVYFAGMSPAVPKGVDYMALLRRAISSLWRRRCVRPIPVQPCACAPMMTQRPKAIQGSRKRPKRRALWPDG